VCQPAAGRFLLQSPTGTITTPVEVRERCENSQHGRGWGFPTGVSHPPSTSAAVHSRCFGSIPLLERFAPGPTTGMRSTEKRLHPVEKFVEHGPGLVRRLPAAPGNLLKGPLRGTRPLTPASSGLTKSVATLYSGPSSRSSSTRFRLPGMARRNHETAAKFPLGSRRRVVSLHCWAQL